jgi:hypothetical protein
MIDRRQAMTGRSVKTLASGPGKAAADEDSE